MSSEGARVGLIMSVGSTSRPVVCLLCSGRQGLATARFRQHYPQTNSPSVLLPWWECRDCNGWFVYPVPEPEVIEHHWGTAHYNDLELENRIALDKQLSHRRILTELSERIRPGRLLDFGCNFGRFMEMACDSGWSPSGFEPYSTAAKVSRSKGFDVRQGWLLDEVGFDSVSFAAIVADDSFYYTWNPFKTLEAFHRLLQPGGVLGMRLSNKRLVLGLVRAVSPQGTMRDAGLSKILSAQFHSIGLGSLSQILRRVGFDRIHVLPHAATAPWSTSPWITRIAYLLADAAYRGSLKTINVYPGVLLFAHKSTC